MILSNDTVSSYNNSRHCAYKQIVCHAPFVNLNFEQTGDVRACCYNFKHVLGKWPQQSIREIWTGEKISVLRNHIKQNDLGGGCRECGKMIEAGNYQGVRAKFYDEFAVPPLASLIQNIGNKITRRFTYPKVMEFELSNTCNLECVMCNGGFSSSIRKNREKLPPIASPYNEKFVEELEEFIPYLTDAKFLGGEPFMIDVYLSIWEKILKINPSIRIHITTNGTFLNQRIKNLLEGLKAGIILSIDSINEETYRKIRVNGNFERVMENLDYFIDYTRRKSTFISIAACPITYNWRELPQMLDFCLEKKIALYFNVVFTPFELSLHELPLNQLDEIISYLQAKKTPFAPESPESPYNLSVRAYNDFVSLLIGWRDEKAVAQSEKEAINNLLSHHTEELVTIDILLQRISNNVKQQVELANGGYDEKQRLLQSELVFLLSAAPAGNVVDCLNAIVLQVFDGKIVDDVIREKLQKIATLIEIHPKRTDVLRTMAQGEPIKMVQFIEQMEISELERLFNGQFGGLV